MGNNVAKELLGKRDAKDATDELSCDVKYGIPGLDLAQPQKRQRRGGVHVCSRLLTPRRVDQTDRR